MTGEDVDGLNCFKNDKLDPIRFKLNAKEGEAVPSAGELFVAGVDLTHLAALYPDKNLSGITYGAIQEYQ